MNWQEVKLSPEAEKLYNDFKYRTVVNFDRLLYDFFDEQGIKIFIKPARPDVPFPNVLLYKWEIQNFLDLDETDFKKYPTRTEAEEQAFLRAFEILEEKLKEAKNG